MDQVPLPLSPTVYTQSRAGDPYRPISIYDTPSVLAEQFLSGHATWSSFRDTILNPDALTPEERRDLSDRLSSSHEPGLSKAMMEVATNPWVWLLFTTGPLGKAALAAGRSLFSMNGAFSSMVKKAAPWFGGLLTDLEVFSDATPQALGISRRVAELGERAIENVVPAQQKLMSHIDSLLPQGHRDAVPWNTADPLNYELYPVGSLRRRLVQDFEVAAAVRAHRLDEAHYRTIPEQTHRIEEKLPGGTWAEMSPARSGTKEYTDAGNVLEQYASLERDVQKAKDQAAQEWWNLKPRERKDWAQAAPQGVGPFQHFFNETYPQYRLVGEQRDLKHFLPAEWRKEWVDQTLARYGAAGKEYMDAVSYQQKLDLVSAIGDEEVFHTTGRLVVSKDKAFMHATDLQRALTQDEGPFGWLHSGSTSLQGKDALLSMLGVERFKKISLIPDVKARTSAVVDAFEEFVSRGLADEASGLPSPWASRNTYESVHVSYAGGQGPPPISLDAVQRASLDNAPWSATSAMSKHFVPITEKERIIHPLDGEQYSHALTDAGKESMKSTKERAQILFAKDRGSLMGLRLKFTESYNRYTRNIHQDIAYNATPADLASIKSDSDSIPNIRPEVRNKRTWVGGGIHLPVTADLSRLPADKRAQVSYGMLMDRFYLRHEGAPALQRRIRDSLVPGALNNAGPEYIAVYNSHLRSKELARWFSGSWLGNTIRGWGGKSAALMDRIDQIGDFSTPVYGTDFSSGLARWFYASHLGLNVSSAILNLMQPLVLAGQIGTPLEVMGAYADSFKEMLGYAKDRSALGKAFITPAKKLELMKKNFEGMGRGTSGRNLLGIGPDPHSVIDSHMIRQSDTLLDRAEDIALKLFEKTEWLNRNTAYHLSRRAYIRSGRNPSTDPDFLNDTERFILQTQYGQNDLNTPPIFRNGLLGNPLFRQFFTFPVRTATGVFHTFPKMGGEESYWQGLGKVLLRGMGMSAIVYEAGKGLFNADLSRGLFFSGAMDLVGGERFLEKQGDILQLPPVAAVPLDLIRGVASNDMKLLASAIARTIPGGVAINRAIGIAPQFPSMIGDFPSNLQSTYADWDHPNPEGLIPIFKRDGTLIEYRSPSEITMKALGADLGKWQQQGALDNYLVKQRDQTIEYRHRYLQAIAANDVSRAQSIAREYETRYEVPLTVTQEQVRDYLSNRVVGRTERALDRLPADVRPSFQQMAQASGAGGSLRPGGITQGASSRQRDPFRNQPVTREQVQEMLRRQGEVGRGATKETSPFSSFR